jgi:hypothetical protein
MKAIIDGLRYDTETAELLTKTTHGNNRNDFAFEETELYRTKAGRFFLAGHGGPRSRWSRATAQNEWTGGEGIKPLFENEAREFLEKECPQTPGVLLLLEKYFDIKEA